MRRRNCRGHSPGLPEKVGAADVDGKAIVRGLVKDQGGDDRRVGDDG